MFLNILEILPLVALKPEDDIPMNEVFQLIETVPSSIIDATETSLTDGVEVMQITSSEIDDPVINKPYEVKIQTYLNFKFIIFSQFFCSNRVMKKERSFVIEKISSHYILLQLLLSKDLSLYNLYFIEILCLI